MSETFVSGLLEPEGPVLLPDGRWAVVEMDPARGCVTIVDAEGVSANQLVKTGRPNGMALGADGSLWVAESKVPSLLNLKLDGTFEVVLTEDEHGRPFLFPNDLAFGPDGTLYMTDSGIQYDDIIVNGAIREDYARAPYDGRVYRIDTVSGRIETVDSGHNFLNGICIGTDQSLYTNDTITGDVYRYGLGGDRIGPCELFGNVMDTTRPPSFRGPDGMAHGADGRLFVTVFNQQELVVLDIDGGWNCRIATAGARPTNVAFHGTETKIFVTEAEAGAIEVFDVGTGGAPLFYG